MKAQLKLDFNEKVKIYLGCKLNQSFLLGALIGNAPYGVNKQREGHLLMRGHSYGYTDWRTFGAKHRWTCVNIATASMCCRIKEVMMKYFKKNKRNLTSSGACRLLLSVSCG